jgi:hypothetical protein
MGEHRVPHPDLAGYMFGVLNPDQTHAFESHLAHCAVCRAEARELQTLPALLTVGTPVELPAELREHTFARIHAEAPRAVSVHPVGGPASRGRLNGRVFPARATRSQPITPRRRGRLLALAAAVVLVLVGAGAVVAGLYWGPDRAPGGSANRPAGSDNVTLNLVAADGGPQRGVARITQTPAGRIVHLQVRNLAPPPPGQRYVCWFVGPGDSPHRPNRVTIGSFTPDQHGRAEVTLTGAAATQRFPLLGVTREPDDGNPQRRGPKVLVTKPPT